MEQLDHLLIQVVKLKANAAHDLSRQVLVLYLKRPRAKSWELRRCVGGASDTAT
jgi:hypothetical protein